MLLAANPSLIDNKERQSKAEMETKFYETDANLYT